MRCLLKINQSLPAAFVTFGWCRSAYTVLRSLANRGVEVHVGDNSRMAMSRFSRYAKSFTRLPDFYTEPEAYIEAVSRAMTSYGAKVLLPCFEDVELVMRYRDRLPAGARVALPALKDWLQAEDKLDYLAPVRAAGVPVPATLKIHDNKSLLNAAAKVSYPAIVKVRVGHGARGVEIVHSEEALRQVVQRLVETFDLSPARWPIVQQYLRGRKFKLDGVFCHGEPIGMCPFEILRCKGSGKFGTSTYRRSVDHAAVVEYATTALKALSWHGMFNTDWVCDEAGIPHLIDVNGRLSGAVAVPYEAGVDLPWLWYQVSAGFPPDEAEATQAGVYVRWLLGDGIALVEHLLAGEFRQLRGAPPPVAGCRYDDFIWSDPAPFFGQVADYLVKFVVSGGSTKPITRNMVR
mgnify:FL=1